MRTATLLITFGVALCLTALAWWAMPAVPAALATAGLTLAATGAAAIDIGSPNEPR